MSQSALQPDTSDAAPLLTRVKFKFHFGDLLGLSAGAGRIWIAASGRQLFWHDSVSQGGSAQQNQRPIVDEVAEFQIQTTEEISRIFANPSGLACLVTTTSNSVYLCHTTPGSQPQGKRQFTVRAVNSLKGHVISCVAWSPFSLDRPAFQKSKTNLSGPVLVGTDRGDIMEVEFTYGDSSLQIARVLGQQQQQQSQPDIYCELVYKLPGSCAGLYYSKTSSPSNMADAQHCVVATTSSGALYQLVGVCGTFSSSAFGQLPSIIPNMFNIQQASQTSGNAASSSAVTTCFQPLFRAYPEAPMLTCIEMPPANLPPSSSSIAIYQPQDTPPTCFSWLTASGIYAAQFDLSPTCIDNKMFLCKQKLIYFPKAIRGGATSGGRVATSGSVGKPVGISIGQFHALVLFEKSALMYNTLSEQLVEDDKMEDISETILGVTQDPVRHTIWIWTRNYIYHYTLVNEDRDIWKYFLSINDFEKARKFCSNDRAKLNRVLMETAKSSYSSGDYVKCAQYYAESQAPIEGIVPDLLALPDRTPLRIYLLRRFDLLSPGYNEGGPAATGTSPQNVSAALTTLILWLIDVFLAQLSEKDREDRPSVTAARPQSPSTLLSEFRSFLSRRDVLEVLTQLGSRRYELFLSHGDWDNAIFVAELVRDWSTVCNYYIMKRQYREALNVIEKHKGRDNRFFMGSCLPQLLRFLPTETLRLLRELGQSLKPQTMVPALVELELSLPANSPVIGDIINYLRHAIEKMGFKDAALHNYLLLLLSKYQQSDLVPYLERYCNDPHVPFDVKFATNICERAGLNQALVLLYPLAQNYEEAIAAALRVNVDLAKSLAKKLKSSRPQAVDDDTRRQIWFAIAKHVINAEHGQHSGIARALEIVNDSDRLIRIEDLLPFFSDSVTIDQFKDAILSSLQDYKERVAKSREDLDHCSRAAEQMARDATSLKQMAVSVSGADRCYTCRAPLYLREFYVFPCSHHIHRACAVQMASIILPPAKTKRVEDSYRALCSNNCSPSVAEQLDKLLANDCPLCGDIAVQSIDQGFIPPGASMQELYNSWL